MIITITGVRGVLSFKGVLYFDSSHSGNIMKLQKVQ